LQLVLFFGIPLDVTAQQFRHIALSLPQVEEREHMGHPDFRVNGKIFATLSYPDEEYGVVMLSPAEQKRFMRERPEELTPAKGAWGRRGHTQVRLGKIGEATLREALRAAWRTRAPKGLEISPENESE
jgi:hypothetical protein